MTTAARGFKRGDEDAEAEFVDDDLKMMLVLVGIALGGVCAATGVLSSVSDMITQGIRGLF